MLKCNRVENDLHQYGRFTSIWQIYIDQIKGLNIDNGSIVPLEPDNKVFDPLCHKKRRSSEGSSYII